MRQDAQLGPAYLKCLDHVLTREGGCNALPVLKRYHQVLIDLTPVGASHARGIRAGTRVWVAARQQHFLRLGEPHTPPFLVCAGVVTAA